MKFLQIIFLSAILVDASKKNKSETYDLLRHRDDGLFVRTKSSSSSSSDPLLVRQDANGVPVMNIEDRSTFGLDESTAPTNEPWRDVHRGFFSTYTGARNKLETPIAMRTQFIYWKIQAAVLAATKIHDVPGLEMLEPFPKENPSTGAHEYSTPSYKLPDHQLQRLYASADNAYELRKFRAEASACALYGWWKEGLTQYMQDEPALDDMEEYLLQLALPSGDRTHFGFKAWKGTWDDIQVDVTGPCVETKPPGKVQGNKRDHSPQCVGIGITNTIRSWQGDDGWNQLGTDRGTGELRAQPFKDVIGFQATHTEGHSGDRRNWAPLRECKSGFCARQEHVVPHIGFRGRSYFLNETDRTTIVGGVVKPLIVDYKAEIGKVLSAVENVVAESPLYKSKIAYHDNKFQFAAGTRQIRGRNKNTWEEQIFMQNAFLGVEYEGLIINWQAKVLNNHVRPPTVAQELLGDQMITSWQYGADSKASYPAKEWTPYIRTMPHGEFPSGSACLCSGGVAIYAELFNRPVNHPSLNVTINFTETNSVEPDRFKNILFDLEFYSSLEDYANECAENRFNGGMHYEFSLEPGSRMCTTDGDFTKKSAAYNKYLWTGNENFLAPFGGIGAFGFKGDRDYDWY